MTWRTAHPLVIDPDADRPTLVGSTWRRRAPLGDVWDRVRVVGLHDNGPDNGGLELVVQTVEFTGDPTLTASPESFGAAYTRTTADDPLERLDARLRELEARG